MADDVYQFDEDGTRRIVDAVRRIEQWQPQPRDNVPVGHGANIQFVRITGAGTASGGVTYYPGCLRQFAASGGWSDIGTPPTVWLIHTTGATLTTTGSAVYEARQMQADISVSGTRRPLFATNDRPFVMAVACVSNAIDVTTAG